MAVNGGKHNRHGVFLFENLIKFSYNGKYFEY